MSTAKELRLFFKFRSNDDCFHFFKNVQQFLLTLMYFCSLLRNVIDKSVYFIQTAIFNPLFCTLLNCSIYLSGIFFNE